MRCCLIFIFIFSILMVPVSAYEVLPEDDMDSSSYSVDRAAPNVDFSIIVQPFSQTVPLNSTVKFTVIASGSDLSYRWEYSTNGGAGWRSSSSATQGYNTPTLSVVATETRNGFLYRCVVSNSSGSVTSDVAMLSVSSDSSINSWNSNDILYLFTVAVSAAGSWFTSILTATGMTSFYTTVIIIFLVISILISPILGSVLSSASDSVNRKSKNDKNNS